MTPQKLQERNLWVLTPQEATAERSLGCELWGKGPPFPCDNETMPIPLLPLSVMRKVLKLKYTHPPNNKKTLKIT